jgi:hypothetical protein
VLEETDVTCPGCGETISILLDLSVDAQDYIEDCSVCCAPMRVIVSASDGELIDVHVEAASG